MAEECSLRVSSQEEDLLLRSTKKVKTRDSVDLNQLCNDMELVAKEPQVSQANRISYKDSLLTPPGPLLDNIDLDIGDVHEDDPNPEDKWYRTTILICRRRNLSIIVQLSLSQKKNLKNGANHGMLP
ncbi:hypothetical protein PIB30_006603 [Stylosanthes scabra]|uniref:Uncharacterized protein n=1 Tax=Stylosanthes scabra TaxID=79078 RepID=A0ABU6Z504_9FABA|nr:hypothetical protein [Stylosanthes scabra]